MTNSTDIVTTGSRAKVWHGTAKHTSGGLTKKDLMKNKRGKIVSRSKHFSSKKENRLVKAGYSTKKGTFGSVQSYTPSRCVGRKMRACKNSRGCSIARGKSVKAYCRVSKNRRSTSKRSTSKSKSSRSKSGSRLLLK